MDWLVKRAGNVDVERAHLNKILREVATDVESKLDITAITAGTNVTVVYDEVANTLTINASGGGGTGNSYTPGGW